MLEETKPRASFSRLEAARYWQAARETREE
jgi:hypothetical protein